MKIPKPILASIIITVFFKVILKILFIAHEKNVSQNVRDWSHVTDHCSAIFSVLKQGKIHQTYNIGGNK